MKISFVIHGLLPGLESLKQSIINCFEDDFEIKLFTTSDERGATDLVRNAIESGTDYVIVAGGDGSVNEAVNGYMMTAEQTRKSVAIGVLPMGTGNDFSKSLRVTSDLNALHMLISNQSIIDVDVCLMKFRNFENQIDKRYFINIADIGIGGYVVEKFRDSSKTWNSNLLYFKAIISSFINYRKQPITILSPAFKWEGEVMSLCMANGKYFGSGMCIAPNAQLNDGDMQVVILGNISILDYLKNLGKIKKGVKLTHPEVTYATATSLAITSNGNPCPIDMDGEFIGYTPLEVNVLSKSVRFLSPTSAKQPSIHKATS